MELQLLFTPGCVECLALQIRIRRIKPDYPELEVEEINLVAQPQLATQYGLRSVPGIVINGKLIARKHINEAELRRALLRRRPRHRFL